MLKWLNKLVIQVLWWCCLHLEKNISWCKSSSSFVNHPSNSSLEIWTSSVHWRSYTTGKRNYWYIWAVRRTALCNCCDTPVSILLFLCFYKIIVTLYVDILYLFSGDRTPKQKVKLKVTEEKLLNLMLKYNGGKPRVEVPSFLNLEFYLTYGA